MKEGLDCTDNSETPNQENIAFIIVHGNYCFWSQLGGGGLRGRRLCPQVWWLSQSNLENKTQDLSMNQLFLEATSVWGRKGGACVHRVFWSSQSNPEKTKPKSCPCSLIAFGGNLLLWFASPQGLCGVSIAVRSDRPKAIKRKRTQKFVQEPILLGGNWQVERPLQFFPQIFLISKN
jgi:hypothetical protein